MKFRWEYLSESFDNEKAFKKIKIKSKHRNLNLNDLLINFDESEEDYRNRLNSLYEEKTIKDKENLNKTLKRDIRIGDILTREEMSSFSMIFLRYRKELDKFNLDRIDENTPFEKIEEAYSQSNIPVLQERLKFLKDKLEEKENEVII